MPAHPQTGPQTQGTRTQTAPAQPGPQQRTAALSAWIDEVVAAGGVTADATDVTRLQAASDHLAEVIAAGGTDLGPDQERLIGSIAHDLRRVALAGDGAAPGGDSAYGTVLGQAEYRLEEFLDAQGGLLSDEASSRLAGALATIESVYADGVVSTAERTQVGAAADAVCGVLKDDFTKLSAAGLADLQGQQTDLTALIDTGFLTLDAAQWSAITTADAALDALSASSGAAGRAAAHEALDGLRTVMAGAILDLASPADALGRRGQYGGGDAGLGFFGG